jgi:N-acetylglucosamine kinase-like BadF-type ATPase
MNTKEIVDAIRYISPEAEFSFKEDDLDTIVFDKPKTGYPTKEEILEAVEPAKAKAQADLDAAQAAKAAVLERLGITEDEAKLILG